MNNINNEKSTPWLNSQSAKQQPANEPGNKQFSPARKKTKGGTKGDRKSNRVEFYYQATKV